MFQTPIRKPHKQHADFRWGGTMTMTDNVHNVQNQRCQCSVSMWLHAWCSREFHRSYPACSPKSGSCGSECLGEGTFGKGAFGY